VSNFLWRDEVLASFREDLGASGFQSAKALMILADHSRLIGVLQRLLVVVRESSVLVTVPEGLNNLLQNIVSFGC
jgi:hypothetical protein